MDVEMHIILFVLIRAIQLCWYVKPPKFFFKQKGIFFGHRVYKADLLQSVLVCPVQCAPYIFNVSLSITGWKRSNQQHTAIFIYKPNDQLQSYSMTYIVIVSWYLSKTLESGFWLSKVKNKILGKVVNTFPKHRVDSDYQKSKTKF
jgi:hypothetical protein